MLDVFLSVIIPAYNEERRIGKTLAAIRQYLDRQDYEYKVVVSDDGSRDTTIPIVQVIQEGWKQLQLVQAPYNQGKGAAVKRAMLDARGKYLLFTDADSSTPIEEIEKLLPHIQDYEIVFGSRHCPGAHVHISQAWYRILLSRLSNLLIRFMAVPGVYDTQCGFKLFERNAGKNVFANVTLDRFGFDFEALMIARRLKYRMKEVGINWYNDEESKVRTGREAIRTLMDLFRVRWRMMQGKYDSVGYINRASISKSATERKTISTEN